MVANDAGQQDAADYDLCCRVKEHGIVPIEEWVRKRIRSMTSDACVASRTFDTFTDWLNTEGRLQIDCHKAWQAWLWQNIVWKKNAAAKWCNVAGRRGFEIDPDRDGFCLEEQIEYQDLIQHCLDKMDKKHRDAILLSWLRLEKREIAEVLGRDTGDTSKLCANARSLLGDCVRQQIDGGDSS